MQQQRHFQLPSILPLSSSQSLFNQMMATATVVVLTILSTIILRHESCEAFLFVPRQQLSLYAITKQSSSLSSSSSSSSTSSTSEVLTNDIIKSSVNDQSWIIREIEKQQQISSTSMHTDFLIRQGVIGPSKVLIYDTTLRGM
jgi:hypothetical protein